MRKTIDQQAYQMIADGVLGHSTSPYSAPIMLAKKKCGGWRFLTDFRKINEKCEKVVYPLPRIEDSLQKLDNPEFFSSLDLTKGFWQIEVHPEDRKYFAFSTESMHLEYLVAPMGAKNSPSTLCALMQLVLRGLPPQHVISYLDDILVATGTMDDHILYLDKVLNALEKAGLKLNPAKCSIAQESVVCLGHKLSKDGVAPDPANIAKIRAWDAPANVKKLKTFLGLTGYYRQFVRNYAKIAQPLTELTKDDVDWVWKDEQQKAYEELKNILVSNQVMNYPDFEKPFIVKSDASLTAIGYVLTQKFDGKERVISYGSKKLNPTQRRWSTYDREFYALLCAVRANSHYLRHAPFVAITDHRPLLAWRKVDTKKDPTGRRTRWSIELDTYEFELIYKEGRIHADADAMSRLGGENDEEAEDDNEEFTAVLLGMEDRDHYSAACYNIEKEARDELRNAQDDDPVISEAKKFIKAGKRIPRKFPHSWYECASKLLVIRKGILYKKSYSDIVHAEVLQAVIPRSLRKQVLSDLHGDYLSGHPNAENMLLKVKRYAIWPTIRKDTERFVKNCKECDQEREPNPKNRTPRVPLDSRNVWDWVVCDLLKLPVASGNFQYVLVFIDVFSGFVKLYKLKNKNTEGVCRAFENLVCLIGPPRLLTSDNGGEFTSDLLKSICEVKGTNKRTSVAYRPQSQGPVERFNRTLIKNLRTRLQQYGKSWVDHLQYVEWAYNTTPRSDSKMTPYSLMYGREPPLPTFVDVDEAKVKDKDLRNYFKKMKNRSKETYDEARRRILEKKAKEIEAYNKKVKHTPLVPGDDVYEEIPEGLRTKIQPKWDNLMKVVRRRIGPKGGSGTTYECRRNDGSSCERNYEQLKRSRRETSPEQSDWESPPELVTPTSGNNPAVTAPVPGTPALPPALISEELSNLWVFAAAFSPTRSATQSATPAVTSALSTPPLGAPQATQNQPVSPIATPQTILVLGEPTSETSQADATRPPLTHVTVVQTNLLSSIPDPVTGSQEIPEAQPGPSGIARERLTVIPAPPPSSPSESLRSIKEETDTMDDPTVEESLGLDDVFATTDDTGLQDGATAATGDRVSRTTVGYLEKSQYYQYATHSFVSNRNQQGAASDEVSTATTSSSALPPSGGAKAKKSKNKASDTARGKYKDVSQYDGAVTRRRNKIRREEEERVKEGLSKLLATGRHLTDSDLSEEDAEANPHLPPSGAVGDFSADDLIRNKIADPRSFDVDSNPVDSDEVLIVSHDSDMQLQTSVDNVNNRWSFNLNPFSYYLQRNEKEQAAPSGDNEPQSTSRRNTAVASITDDAEPQCASTPTEQ